MNARPFSPSFLFPLAALVLVAVGPVSAARAADVLFLKNGTQRAGRILGVEGANFRVEVPLARPPGATGPAPTASVAVPRADIVRVEFAPDHARDQLLLTATPAQIERVAALWSRAEPQLDLPRAAAGRIGIAYANLLLKTERPDAPARALAIFKRIEAAAWEETDRSAARQGRLRAMVATGDAKSAIAEAQELARTAEDPSVLVEAKFILGRAADASLRQLVADNPRWQEDINVIPEHARQLNEALDHYLYAALFFGADDAASARGLGAAVDLYRFVDDTPLALETARDTVAFYPGTPAATAARAYLDSLTKKQPQQDYEKEAREQLAPTPNEP